MRNLSTMIQREIGSYFLSPIAYAVAAIFLFACGLAFGLGNFTPGGESSLRPLLNPWIVLILVFVLPMLTMRLLCDELRSGTIETLMTAPISEVEVVLGKFFGAMAFFAILLGSLLLYPILIGMYGDLDLKLLLCNGLGLLFIGGLYVSVGLFFSSCTKHQVISVLLSFMVLALMTFAFHELAGLLEGWMKVVMQQLSIRTHFDDFVRGMLDTNHVVFFLTTTAFFLFLTVKRLEMRRWQ